MNYSVNIVLDKRRANKYGRFPVILRLIIQGRSTSISLNIHSKPSEWDAKNQCVKTGVRRFENINRLNNKIAKERTKLYDQLIKFEDQGQLYSYSLKELKQRLLMSNKQVTLYAFTQKIIKELKDQGRIGNALVYQHTIDWIEKYGSNSSITISQMTFNWLKKLETSYLAKGRKLNGLSVRMRTIRAIYNRAVAEEIATPDSNPFIKYTIRTEPTSKRALTELDFLKIKEAKSLVGVELRRAREYFLISYYLMGASFADMAHLKLNNIQDNRVKYRRQKTRQLHSIKITKQLSLLLKGYMRGKSSEDYLLPILTLGMTKEEAYNRVKNKRKRYNLTLKELGAHLGIGMAHLTSYSSRHTFATMARDKDVNLSVISNMLGHKDTRTTEIYLATLNDGVVDEALEEMLI